ncbi:MAG: NADP-dependent malic enzyme [Brevinematales bacterium]|nr:NADP-dependent malic enzyme [Brevinematales bacterium]
MDKSQLEKLSLNYHRNSGKIEVIPKVSVKKREELSLAYTPGVAFPCIHISKNEDLVYDYTFKSNSIFIVSDGSAVLGLGNIGHKASLPVMEGKALLFKIFGGIDAYPIILNTQDTREIINTVKTIADGVGGINLEDISAPRCFEVEDRLSEELDIPVFHDDQHGTAVVTLAGLINALKLTAKEMSKIKIVINGSGAAGVAIANLLLYAGVENIIMCDRKGIIYEGREDDMNEIKNKMATKTNRDKIKGDLKDALIGADVFIGVSVKDALKPEMIKKMNDKPIIFAMANPDPEILPEEAYKAKAYIVATGRSDFPNQINNCIAFPGIFRGLLDTRAKKVTMEMKFAASKAIANFISDHSLKQDRIIPSVFELKLHATIAEEVATVAMKENLARINVKSGEVFEKALRILKLNRKRFF